MGAATTRRVKRQRVKRDDAGAEEHLARDVTASPAPSDADAGEIRRVGVETPAREPGAAKAVERRGAHRGWSRRRRGSRRGARRWSRRRRGSRERRPHDVGVGAKTWPTSTSVYAARAFGTGKPDVGMTVLLAASNSERAGSGTARGNRRRRRRRRCGDEDATRILRRPDAVPRTPFFFRGTSQQWTRITRSRRARVDSTSVSPRWLPRNLPPGPPRDRTLCAWAALLAPAHRAPPFPTVR